MKRLHLVITIITSFAALTLHGCMDAMHSLAPCITEEQCPGDQQCILGTCMSVPDFQVDIEVFPAANSGYLQQPVRSMDIASLDSFQVVVPPPTVVRGELHSNQVPYSGPARVAFSATDVGLRRSSLRFSTETQAAAEESDSEGSFEVRLVGSVIDGGRNEPITYSITATPLDLLDCCENEEDLCPAPMAMHGWRFRADDNLVLAFADSPTRIRGRVLVETGSELAPAATQGAKIEALHDRDSLHSLPATTGEDGGFCLALDLPDPGTETTVKLRVAPSPEHPTFTLQHELRVTAGGIVDDVEIVLPPPRRPESVLGRVLDRRSDPVEGARVSFAGEVEGGGVYHTAVWTDDDGAFAVELLPGAYTVRALPPESSKASAMLMPELVIGSSKTATSAPPVELTTRDRHVISGKVASPDPEGRPVSDVEVIAELDLATGADAATRLVRFSAETDADGRFVLALDPGAYRLHFRPSWASGLPWMTGPLVFVEADAATEIGTVFLEEAAIMAGKALGQVEGGTTVPLAGARIEVHARRLDKTFFLWEGRASEDGSFDVVLPRGLTGRVEAAGWPEKAVEGPR